MAASQAVAAGAAASLRAVRKRTVLPHTLTSRTSQSPKHGFGIGHTEWVTSERSDAFRRLGGAFARGGGSYEKLRPGYPPEAVAFLTEGIESGAKAVDIGAGTGKLTAALAARGLSMTAVDPSRDMLEQLSRQLPAVDVRVGTGEQTGLPGHAVVLATFAQSWHWVDSAAGISELVRILAPGGRAGWVWNFMDIRVSWVAELASIWHTIAGDEAVDATRHQPEVRPPIGAVEATTIDWIVEMDVQSLGALVTTRSYYLSASDLEQSQIRHDVDAFLSSQFADDETIDLPYRTHCFRARMGTAVPRN